MSQATPRILIIQRRYLGDLVLMTAVFRNVRLEHPQAHVVVLCDQGYAPLLESHHDLDGVEEIPLRQKGESRFKRWKRWIGLVRKLRAHQFTHVLDYSRNERSALLGWLTGARHRITYQFAEYPRLLCRFYTRVVPLSHSIYRTEHQQEFYLKLLKGLDVPVTERTLSLAWKPEEETRIDSLLDRVLKRTGKPLLMIHPGSRVPARRWPAEYFATVIEVLQNEGRADLLLVASGPELGLLREVQAHLKTPIAAVDEGLTIPQFAALFHRAHLVLCHDSGPMHIASAVGVPLVALFGSQSPTLWHPIGVPHTLIQTPQPCPGCLFPGQCHAENSYENFCIRHITVDLVVSAVQERLAALVR